VELCSPTVFVIDNESATCDRVAALASSMKLGCRSFSSAEQFLNHYDPMQPGCAVIDLQLEGMGGVKLHEHLTHLHNSIPVVCVGAYLNVSTAVRAMQNGAITVLEKPCQNEQLTDAIRKAIDINREEQAARIKWIDLSKRFNSLEPREYQVMMLIVKGLPNKTIARQLGISQRTVSRIRADIFGKIGVECAVDLAQIAVEYFSMLADD
jgi:RNA polymerase sigma factor (sigma-70 family)